MAAIGQSGWPRSAPEELAFAIFMWIEVRCKARRPHSAWACSPPSSTRPFTLQPNRLHA